MCYLHSLDILHGDLTGGNILLISSNKDLRGFIAKVSACDSLLRHCMCSCRELFVGVWPQWGRYILISIRQQPVPCK